MANVIPLRIADFLSKFPPFNIMSSVELNDIAHRCQVKYVQKDTNIFKEGDQPGFYFYVVHDGAISLFSDDGESHSLIDVCDEGDIFGLRALIASDSYRYTAQAKEESLVYAIHIDSITPILEQNNKVGAYLLQSFATGHSKTPGDSALVGDFHISSTEYQGMAHLIDIKEIKEPATCLLDASISEAALVMQEFQSGSIIVINESNHPVGIATDRDFRNKVVATRLDPDKGIKDIMSSPVVTIGRGESVFDIQMKMMENNIRHLCLTDNGEQDSPLIGVISEHDLNVFQGRNPAVFIKEISKCKSVKELKGIRSSAEHLLSNFLDLEVSIEFISRMMTRINDAVVKKAIELTLNHLTNKGMEIPSKGWCWMSLGSAGRKEQIIRTDQDHAIVFEDVLGNDQDTLKTYFHKLAVGVSGILYECGFELCPSKMMATNPRWCLSISEWKDQFTHWIKHPTEKNIMYCTIFFDFRPVYGDTKLTETLSHHIRNIIDPASMFVVNMGKNAIQNPPPLTFFRNIVVERNGQHKDEFDLKARAMMPLVDAARLLTITSNVPYVTNTIERYITLAQIDANNADLFKQAAESFEELLKYKAYHGLKNNDDGRYIDPKGLSKMERLTLRNCFRPIAELHKLLLVRFRLSQFI